MPGDRVGDVYEVCGQVVKSAVWLKGPEKILAKLNHRLSQGSCFLEGKGDRLAMSRLLDPARTRALRFRLYLVQPGITAARISERLGAPLAAARHYVNRCCGGEVRLMSSP